MLRKFPLAYRECSVIRTGVLRILCVTNPNLAKLQQELNSRISRSRPPKSFNNLQLIRSLSPDHHNLRLQRHERPEKKRESCMDGGYHKNLIQESDRSDNWLNYNNPNPKSR